MKKITTDVARPPQLIGRAKVALCAGVIGLLGLTLGGCTGNNTALLEANRALQEQNTKLVQDNGSLHTLNQQLQDGITGRDKTMSQMQAMINDLRAGRSGMQSTLADLEKRLATTGFGNIMLDTDTNAALAAMAAEHSDLLEYDATRGLIRFKSDVTFDSGSDKLKDTARSTLHQFAQILNTTAKDYDVRVVGHTDAQPIVITKAQHPTNWHLSCHRAISVLKELNSNGFAYDRGEACGRGEFQPIETGVTKSAKNRRVEVYLTKSYRNTGATTRFEATTPAKAPATTKASEEFMK